MTKQPVATPQSDRTTRKSNSGSRMIELEFPIEFAGEHYTHLKVRRLKAKHLRKLDLLEGGGQAVGIAMAALICDVDEGVIDELDMVDYLKVQEAIAAFFPKALVERLQPKA